MSIVPLPFKRRPVYEDDFETTIVVKERKLHALQMLSLFQMVYIR